jgi:hypothetical protein
MTFARHIIAGCLLFVFPVALACADTTTTALDEPWQQLTEGLDLARFPIGAGSVQDSTIVVLRIDPDLFQMRAFCLSNTDQESGLSVREWCTEYGLIAATNAGMFLQDHSTHVGYLKSGDHINNPTVITRDYRSAAAYGPTSDSLPRFRIFDLDEEPIDSAIANYDLVVQNIRLIKRPGENRWPPRDKKWSEAALGEDGAGNILFIFSRIAWTMHDFNERLLALPIDIVAAQHLEGGPEAQLFVRWEQFELELVGDSEDGFVQNNTLAWPVPNILGISPRR